MRIQSSLSVSRGSFVAAAAPNARRATIAVIKASGVDRLRRSAKASTSSSSFSPTTSSTSSVSTAAAVASPSSSSFAALRDKKPFADKEWTWRGLPIKYCEASPSTPPKGIVVLVHGFGASAGHWRKNLPVIAESGYRVLAPDLVGFGASAKPLDEATSKPAVEFSTALWRDFVVDFVKEVALGGGEAPLPPLFLAGNSLGSLIALRVAAEFPRSSSPSAPPENPIAGVALLNLAGGMNNKAASGGDGDGAGGDWRLSLAKPLFALIDLLLSIRPVATKLFDSFRSPESLRNVLSSVYVNQDAVDDALVELIAAPARDKGALEAFVAIITGDPGPRPEQVIKTLPESTNLLFVWGTKDVFTPVDGPVGTWARKLPGLRANTSFELIDGVGHCLHDEAEDIVNEKVISWLDEVVVGSSSSKSE